MHHTGARIFAAHRVTGAGGGYQLTHGGLGTETLSTDAHPTAQSHAVVILKISIILACSQGITCAYSYSFNSTQVTHLTVTQRSQTIHPGQHLWHSLQHTR